MKIRNLKHRHVFNPTPVTVAQIMEMEWQRNAERVRAFNQKVGFCAFSEDTFILQDELDHLANYNLATSTPFFYREAA